MRSPSTEHDVVAALEGTVLAGRAVEAGLGGALVVSDVGPSEILPAWQVARAAVPRTGRWPVFTGAGDRLDEPESWTDVADLDRAARTVDPWSVLRRNVWDDDPLDRSGVEHYVTECVGADRLPQAAAQVPVPTLAELDRWVYDTVLADPDLADRVRHMFQYLIGTGNWFTPKRVQLVLLPTPHPWLAPAWTSYHGALTAELMQACAAAMYQWHQRWDAELVACWGTMLQFTVERQPDLGEPAWELAGQLMALGESLQEERWMLAMAVTESDAWFLHDKP
jgi:hypothetical protein